MARLHLEDGTLVVLLSGFSGRRAQVGQPVKYKDHRGLMAAIARLSAAPPKSPVLAEYDKASGWRVWQATLAPQTEATA